MSFKLWDGKAALVTLRTFPLPQDIIKLEPTDTVGLEMSRQELQSILKQYDVILEQLDALEQNIESLLSQVSGVQEMVSIPGVGLTTVAGFLAEVDLHQRLLFVCVIPLVAKNPELHALHQYFITRAENPLKKKQSLTALCNKLIRLLFTLGPREKPPREIWRSIVRPYFLKNELSSWLNSSKILIDFLFYLIALKFKIMKNREIKRMNEKNLICRGSMFNMIHPDTELKFVNEQIGLGVFATKLISKGTITWALDDLDQTLDLTYVQSLDPERQKLVRKYTYRDSEGKYILSWDLGRYINHSFHANCISTPYDFEIAVRDIQPGEQLTNDYGFLNLDEPFYCLPEQGTERTLVMKDDILHYYKEWDKLLLAAYKVFDHIEQPLAHLIPQRYKEKVKIAAEKGVVIDSIKTLYFNG